MSEQTELQVAEQRLEFCKENLRHERRMRKNADAILKIQAGRIMKMSTKIARLGESLDRVKAERDALRGK